VNDLRLEISAKRLRQIEDELNELRSENERLKRENSDLRASGLTADAIKNQNKGK
jgi:cell division protein FtsB